MYGVYVTVIIEKVNEKYIYMTLFGLGDINEEGAVDWESFSIWYMLSGHFGVMKQQVAWAGESMSVFDLLQTPLTDPQYKEDLEEGVTIPVAHRLQFAREQESHSADINQGSWL